MVGAVKATLAWVSPATAVPIAGAMGTTGTTVNVRLTWVAARKAELPLWSALMVQEPALIKVNTPAVVIVQTPVVDDVKVTVKPDVDDAPPPKIVKFGVVPKFCVPGLAKVIVCGAFGVTEFDAAEAAPVNGAALVAVTVKV